MNIYSAVGEEDEEQAEPKQLPLRRPAPSPSRPIRSRLSSPRSPRQGRSRRFLIGALTLLLVASIYPLWRTIKLYRADLSMQKARFAAAVPIGANDRVLILSPHLDDETLGAGGTIAHAVRVGARVRVVFFTNGDGSGSTVLSESVRRQRRLSYLEVARLRRAEAVAALRELGVRRSGIIFLGYPDGGLQPMWEEHWDRTSFRSRSTGYDRSPYANSLTPKAPYRGAQVLRDVAAVMARFQPTQVFTTHPADTHPDHWAAYAFTGAALESLRTRPNAPRWTNRAQMFGFLVHHGVWPVPHGYYPTARLAPPAAQQRQNTIWTERNLSGNEHARKTRALERYVSQLVWTPFYLRAFVRRNEPFGALSGAKIGVQSTLVLRDEPNDNIRQTARAGTDLRALWVAPTRDGLRFSLQLGGVPASSADYRLILHPIGNGVTVRRIAVGGARAAARSRLQIAVPWKSLGATRPRALLASVSIRVGNSIFDQSETAVLKLR